MKTFTCLSPFHTGNRLVPWFYGAADEIDRTFPDTCDSCWQVYDSLIEGTPLDKWNPPPYKEWRREFLVKLGMLEACDVACDFFQRRKEIFCIQQAWEICQAKGRIDWMVWYYIRSGFGFGFGNPNEFKRKTIMSIALSYGDFMKRTDEKFQKLIRDYISGHYDKNIQRYKTDLESFDIKFYDFSIYPELDPCAARYGITRRAASIAVIPLMYIHNQDELFRVANHISCVFDCLLYADKIPILQYIPEAPEV